MNVVVLVCNFLSMYILFVVSVTIESVAYRNHRLH